MGIYRDNLSAIVIGRVRELVSFFQKSRRTFLQFDLRKKNFVEHIEKNTATFIGKIYRRYFIDIALRNLDLSIIDIAQDFFEIIVIA